MLEKVAIPLFSAFEKKGRNLVMNIFLITDSTILESIILYLFNGVADVQVYAMSELPLMTNTVAACNFLIVAVEFLDDTVWTSFEFIQSTSIQASYLLVNRQVTSDEYAKAKQSGFSGVLIDPISKFRTMYQPEELVNFLQQRLQNENEEEHDANLIYLGKNTFFHREELWVKSNSHKTPLSEREVHLLNLFINNEGKVITKTKIAKELWNDQIDVGGISKLVKRLREKLGVYDLIEGRKQGGYIYKKTR